MTAGHGGSGAVRQDFMVESGTGYGVIGADMHVFADGVPLYLLANWPAADEADPSWLREMPSRMLNARFAVVDFTGRKDELARLCGWREAGPRLAIQWLHAPGGTGKTRLAAQFAAGSAAVGWKVVSAVRGPGVILPEYSSQDLRPGDAVGLILIVDYADQWPLTHLATLLSNPLFAQSGLRTRVLLLARTADAWERVRAQLTLGAFAASSQFLGPLPAGPARRAEMFAAACDSFGRRYGLADVSGLRSPVPLGHPDLGLTLAVHVAALVAVDAHVEDKRAPADPASLTAYLLDREHDHWQRLRGGTHELNPTERTFTTSPAVMSRVVFIAALAGPVPRAAGIDALRGLDDAPNPGPALADHAVCYPPSQPAGDTVLEPLYPDRLAEDYLALTIPGHAADFPPKAWAVSTSGALLARSPHGDAATWTPRAITFLASAAYRWPHMGDRYLYGLLQEDPQLALDAGSAALSALAGIPSMPMPLLEAIEARFPAGRHVDLDPGIAAVTRRLAAGRLAASLTPEARATVQANLATRLHYAGLHEEALAQEEGAVATYRELAAAHPAAFGRHLAGTLSNLGTHLASLGRRDEALAAEQEATGICQQLAASQGNVTDYDYSLANSLCNLGTRLRDAGRHDEALAATSQAVPILRRLAAASPATFEPDLALALSNLAIHLTAVGRTSESLTSLHAAIGIRRRLAAANPAEHQPSLASSLAALANRLQELQRPTESLRAAQEAVRIYRRLAEASPAVFERDLGRAIANLAVPLAALGHSQDALATTLEAVTIRRRIAASNPAAFEPDLAFSVHNLATHLAAVGRHKEALEASLEAVEIRRRLAAGDPAAFEPDLASSLSDLAVDLGLHGRTAESADAERQAIQIRRRLAATSPAVFEHDLAVSLSNLGITLRELGQYAEGADVTRQALQIYQRLARKGGPRFEPDVALCLSNLGHCQWELGQRREALDALEQSADARRRLTAVDPAKYAPELASSLSNLGVYLLMAGQRRKAAAPIAEAVQVYRRLAGQDPSTYDDRLKDLQEIQRETLLPARFQTGGCGCFAGRAGTV
jgi:tetratricopeptide (TPR) repeat protein